MKDLEINKEYFVKNKSCLARFTKINYGEDSPNRVYMFEVSEDSKTLPLYKAGSTFGLYFWDLDNVVETNLTNKFLNNEYRKLIWDKSKNLVEKISTVIDIEKIVVMGSFTTKKERPADVDLIIMIKTKDIDEDWSTDIQFVPSTNFGQNTIVDAEKWMEEKYGEGNYNTFEFNIEEFKKLND